MPNKDVVKGLIKQGEGRVQEFVGSLIGDAKLMAAGEANETAGKAQETVGHLKEAVGSATRTDNTQETGGHIKEAVDSATHANKT